jgi:hypothetical protein
VELSAAGSDEVTQAYDKLSQIEDDLFRSLTADERATLYALLSRAVETSASAREPNPCVTDEPGPCVEQSAGTPECLGDDHS